MQLTRIKTISEYHRLMGLPKPEHPLISVINLESIRQIPAGGVINMVFDFYSISLKRDFDAKMKYGQQEYDFDEGIMFFISPGQIFGIEVKQGSTLHRSGWMLLIHPDFLWNTPLAKTIRHYEFFDYSVHEALFVSEKEEATLIALIQSMEQEYISRIDKFSQEIIIAQIELLLKHAERFYHRQFITRQVANHQILERVEDLLDTYFNSNDLIKKGLPAVSWMAEALNLSPGYLSAVLRTLTGQGAQQHIHQKLILKAKEKLSVTDLSVGEIAYGLGFEHPQSFSKFFKSKTSLSALDFRQSFN